MSEDAQMQFGSEGYAVLPIFPADRVIEARQSLDRHLDRLGAALHAGAARRHSDAALADRLNLIAKEEKSVAKLLLTALCTDGHRGEILTGLAGDEALNRTAALLARRPLSGAVTRVRASIVAFPQTAHAWHSDVALDDGSDCARVCVTAWIPLGDAGPDHGGLELAAGRRQAPIPHERAAGYSIREADLAECPRATPVCPAGSVLFLDRFTPHRTIPVTQGGRFSLIVWFKAAA